MALLGASACSGDNDVSAGPGGTLGTAPTTTTTAPPPVDPSVIPADPADIDERYVQAVVDALFAVDAEATKIFVETKRLDQRGVDILAAIYVPDELERQKHIWSEGLAKRSEQFLPGVLIKDVQRVIDVRPDCVYVDVESDYAEVATNPRGKLHNYLGLTPKRDSDDPQGRNPTAWMLFMNGVNLDGSQPENPCEGR